MSVPLLKVNYVISIGHNKEYPYGVVIIAELRVNIYDTHIIGFILPLIVFVRNPLLNNLLIYRKIAVVTFGLLAQLARALP